MSQAQIEMVKTSEQVGEPVADAEAEAQPSTSIQGAPNPYASQAQLDKVNEMWLKLET